MKRSSIHARSVCALAGRDFLPACRAHDGLRQEGREELQARLEVRAGAAVGEGRAGVHARRRRRPLERRVPAALSPRRLQRLADSTCSRAARSPSSATTSALITPFDRLTAMTLSTSWPSPRWSACCACNARRRARPPGRGRRRRQRQRQRHPRPENQSARLQARRRPGAGGTPAAPATRNPPPEEVLPPQRTEQLRVIKYNGDLKSFIRNLAEQLEPQRHLRHAIVSARRAPSR